MAYEDSVGKTLPLLRGKVSLQDALEEDIDIIHELSYPEKRLSFWLYLLRHRSQIVQIASRHLNIPQSDFRLGKVDEWIHGSSNVCIPIHIIESTRHLSLPRQAIIRFPLPYKIGESFRPGNIDEKVRCEAATYIWLHSNCPVVRVPRLFGFGFPGTQSFTAIENESCCNRILWYLCRGISWVLGDTLAPYFSHSRQNLLNLGYLIIEHVDEGKLLSSCWDKYRYDQNRRINLFRHLSRIMLCLAKLPLHRIGSWTIDNRGILSLTNRPLTSLLHELENLRIPTNIPQNLTYTWVEPYLLDLIACHDSRIRCQPNSVHNQGDGEAQLAALTAMRALLPKLIDRSFRKGPFVLSLTDLHQSNIFVDDDWRITRIIDLEWACVRPIEMVSPPHWLSSRGLEELGFHLDEYTELHNEFIDAFREEEMASYQSDACTQVIQACWTTGSFWYFQALDCPSSLLALFVDHIQPRFARLSSAAREEFSRVLMPYWDRGTPSFILAKIMEQEQYSSQIREIFAPTTSPVCDAKDKNEGEKETSMEAYV